MTNNLTYLDLVFKGVCIILALYMSGKELAKYSENLDVSTLAYKEFEASEKDKYPMLSICFVPKLGNALFNWTKSKEAFGRSVALEFNRFLEGRDWEETRFNSSILTQMDTHDLMGINKENVFRAVHAQSVLGDVRQSNKELENFDNFFLFLSYQDTTKVCFSRNSFAYGSFKRKHDVLSFDMKKVKNLFMSEGYDDYDGQIRIYLHYPGQMRRNIGNEAHKIEAKNLMKSTMR